MRKIILILLFGITVQLGYGQSELINDFDKGVNFLNSENYKKAVETFSDVLKKATDDKLKKMSYIYRAFSYNGLGDYQKAIPDLDKAIEIDPADIASYTDRGKTKAYSN